MRTPCSSRSTSPMRCSARRCPNCGWSTASCCASTRRRATWAPTWLARNDAGSGGFKLRRYDPAIGFQADRFEEHFAGFGKSNITSMEFRVVLETASRALGLQKGEFNTTDGYLPQDQIKRLRTVDSVQILEAESLRTMYFIIHNARPPLNDVNLRKALCYAFDYDGFINNILSGSVVAQCRHHPGQSVGRAEGPEGLQLRSRQGEGAPGDGEGADAPVGDRRAGGLRPERGRGATACRRARRRSASTSS